MKFTPTTLPGVWIVDLEKHEDDRGFFARSWCQEEFAARGLVTQLAQCNVSFNRKKGTLRGMHYQAPPHEEAKLVRCIRGSIYDVALDLRPGSPTFKQWTAVELSAASGRSLYLPHGCAHGFQSLEDDTEVFYQMSEFYHPEATRGVRWNDPCLKITWPIHATIISQRDQDLPYLGALA